MRYYFVDYENVDVAGFDGMSELCEMDVVYLYYSEKHNRLTFGLHRRIIASKATFFYRKIQNGEKDALDLELVREQDNVIQQNLKMELLAKTEYYIISNDRGYDEKIKQWNERGARVERCANIKESALTEEEKLLREKRKLEAEIAEIKKEKETLLREKKMLQAEVNALKENGRTRKEKLKMRLRNIGMSEGELKTIEPSLDEMINAKDRGTRSGNLTKLLPGRKLKNYLDAFENL